MVTKLLPTGACSDLGRSFPQSFHQGIARGCLLMMAREFKPALFFVMMALGAFAVCEVTGFYTHRAAHGRTAKERSAYAIGWKAGEQASVETILPTDAELNM